MSASLCRVGVNGREAQKEIRCFPAKSFSYQPLRVM